jgi:helicase-like protein/RAD3-like DEAD/DEAH box helicase
MARRHIIASNMTKTTLPTTDDDLRALMLAMKEGGAFDQINHLKTFNAISDLGTAIFSTTPSCVVGGPTGSGKTVGSIAILAAILHRYVCEHIRTAYVSIPLRKGVTGAYAYSNDSILTEDQKQNMGWACGGDVEYRSHQRVRICTTGHVFNRLAKILVSDNKSKLNDMLIIVDEAHTPTSENYLLIALCLYIQEEGYKLKLVIMSATLDSAPLLEEFETCPKVELEGHLYDTQVVHLRSTPEEKYVNKTAIQEIQRYTRMGHNILCFVSGENDIQEISKGLQNDPTLDVCGLISSMPQEEMNLAFEPPPTGQRKVIISTNIAESSVTIPNVDVVIDTGYEIGTEKPMSGRGTIYAKRMISLASAKQRAGRVGRVRPGINVRLWSQSEEMRMQLHSRSDFYSTDPDIQVLNLIALGLDSQRITRLTEYRHSKIITRLSSLELIDREEYGTEWTITDLGTRVLRYKTTLDTSVAFAQLETAENDTGKIVGAYILSLIEGSNGYLPFWVSRDKRSEIVQTGYDDSDFGAFKGQDDLETFFLIFYGEDGLLQHQTTTSSFADARSFRDISKVRKDWTKRYSMNAKQIKNAMRIFQQSIPIILGRRFRLPDADCTRIVDQRIFSPMEYDFIDDTLNAVRQKLVTAFVGEKYIPSMVSAGRGEVEPGYIGKDGTSNRIDKKRSYSKLSEFSDPKKMPKILPFNIAITQRGARFISAMMIDPRPDDPEKDARDERRHALERDIAGQIYSRFGYSDRTSAMIDRAVEDMMRLEALDSFMYGDLTGSGGLTGSSTYAGASAAGPSSNTTRVQVMPKKAIHIAQPMENIPGQSKRFVKLTADHFTHLGGW